MPPGVGDVVEGIDVSHVVNIRKVEVIDCVLTLLHHGDCLINQAFLIVIHAGNEVKGVDVV